MIISRIINKSIFLRAIMLLTATECSAVFTSPRYFNEWMISGHEYQIVVDAIKRCNPGVRFEIKTGDDKITKTIAFIEEHNSADFSNQDLVKIPIDALFIMKQIKSLNLSGNQRLNLNFPVFARLEGKKLAKLAMSNCDLKIGWLEWIFQISTLEKLDISYNDLAKLSTLRIPGNIIACVDMRDLSIAHCCIDLKGFKKLISLFGNLTSIDISGNNSILDTVSESEHLDFGKLKTTLKSLKMTHTRFHKKWLEAFSDLECLENLDISYNYKKTYMGCVFDDTGLNAYNKTLTNLKDEKLDFGKLKKTLKSLNMSHDGFHKKWLEAINDLECLEHLDLSYNQKTISEMDEFAVTGLGTYNRTLISLKIDICGAIDAWIDEIGELDRLESLYIGGDDIFKNSETSNHAFETFTRMKSLKTIVFYRCRFTESRKRDIRAALPNIQIEF